MKKLFYIKTVFGLLMAIVLLSSCLKDDSRYVPFTSSPPVVDFPYAAYNGSVTTAQLSSASATNTVNFLVGCSYNTNSSTPVTIVTTISSSALAAYNSAHGTNYQLLPSTAYTSTSLTVTVTPSISQVISGQEPIVGTPISLPVGLAAVSFTITTSAATPSGTYALPLVISSASGASAVVDQYNTLIYLITVK